MSKPQHFVRLPLLRILVPAVLLGSGLQAQTVYDLSDADSGNISDAARWIRLSGTSSTTPSTGDTITIVGTQGFTSQAQVAINGTRTIANLVYGTADAGTDIARAVIFRGSGSDNTRALSLSGDLTKYDSGTLTFRNNNTSMLSLTVQGNVDVHGGALNFGPNTHGGLNSLNIGGTTTISGGDVFVRLGTTGAFGGIQMSGGTFNLNGGSVLNTDSVTIGAGARLGGAGRIVPRASHGVTVESGGVLLAGGGEGALRIDGGDTSSSVLTLAEGSRVAFDFTGGVGSTIDIWNLGGPGDLVFDNAVLDFTGLVTEGTYTLFNFYTDAGANLGGGSIVGGLILGNGLEQFDTAYLTYTAAGITLTVGHAIPEPAAVGALLGVAGLALACGRRRR